MYARISGILLYAAALTCAVLLFAGQDKVGVRSLDRIWDAGHLPAFTLFAYLLITRWRFTAPRSFWKEFLVIVMVTATASVGIETVQSQFGRTFSIGDIRKNLWGATAAVVLWSPVRLTIKRLWRALLIAAVCLGVLFEAWPVGSALIDEALARRQFPVLSNFESPLEIDRWSGNARFEIDRSIAAEGRASLRIALGLETFSGVALVFFPRDWRGWRHLCFDLFNPGDVPLPLTLRVNDRQHDLDGNRYEDRFNRRILAYPGWQRVVIALEEIRAAPRDRAMQMAEIANVMLFATRLERPRTIHIDNVHLRQ